MFRQPTVNAIMVVVDCLSKRAQVAAVLYRGGTEKRLLRKFMGSEERHTVFKAELLGLSLAT